VRLITQGPQPVVESDDDEVLCACHHLSRIKSPCIHVVGASMNEKEDREEWLMVNTPILPLSNYTH
jgi:hypothetical protein